MGVEYIARSIKNNIDAVRSKTRKDISPEVGKTLFNFIAYHRDNVSNEIFFEFLDLMKGLERYLIRKTRKTISLHSIKRSGAGICSMLIRGNQTKLNLLTRYASELRNSDLRLNGYEMIFP